MRNTLSPVERQIEDEDDDENEDDLVAATPRCDLLRLFCSRFSFEAEGEIRAG